MDTKTATNSSLITEAFKGIGKKDKKGVSPEPRQSSSPPPEEGTGVLPPISDSPISEAFKAITPSEETVDRTISLVGAAFDRTRSAFTLSDDYKDHPLIKRAEGTKSFAENLAAVTPGISIPAFMAYTAIDTYLKDPEKITTPTILMSAAVASMVNKKVGAAWKVWGKIRNPIARLAEKYKYIPAAFGPAVVGYLGADEEGLIQKPEAAVIGAILGPAYVKLMPKLMKAAKPVTYLERIEEQPLKWLGRRWLTASQRMDAKIQQNFALFSKGVGLGQRESLQIFDNMGVGTTKKEEEVIKQFATAGNWLDRSVVKKIKIRKKGSSLEGKRIGQFFKEAEFGSKKSRKEFKRLWYENRVGKDIKFPMSDAVLKERPWTPRDIYRLAMADGMKKSRIDELYKKAFKVRDMYQEAAMAAVKQQTMGREIVDVAKEPPLLEHAIYRANMETYFPRIFKDKKMRKIFGESFESKFSRLSYDDKIEFNRFLTRHATSMNELDMANVLVSPSSAGTKGYYNLTKDIEMAKLFKGLADNGAASSAKKTGEFTTMIKNSAQKGALAGRYVKPEVAFELGQLDAQTIWATRFMNKLLSPWKYGKVILSPTTHARNLISNVILADLGGLPPWRMDIYAQAFLDRKKQGKYWQMTEGAFANNTYYKEEIFNKMGPIGGRSMLDWVLRMTGGGVGAWAGGKIGYDVSDENPLGGIAGVVIGGASGYQFTKRAPEMYQAMEELFKHAKFIHNVKWKGMKVEDAIADGNKWLFDYGDKPSAIKAMNTWVQPFSTFTYKALPRVAEAVTTHPWRFIKYQLAYNAMMGNSIRQLGMTRDEWDELQGKMGSYLQNGHHLLLPNRDKRGNIQLMDWTYIFPWGDINELQNRGVGKLFGNPYFSAPLEAFVFNRTTFGTPVYYDWDTTTDRLMKQFKHIAQQWSPSLTPGIGFNYQLLDKAFKETEDSRTKAQAIGAAFGGVKITPLQEGEVYEKSYNTETRRMAEAETQRQKDVEGGMPPDKAAEKYQDALTQIRKLGGKE